MAFIDDNSGYMNRNIKQAKIKLTRVMLDQFIHYLLTDSEYIRDADVRNLKRMLDEINPEEVYTMAETNLKDKFKFLDLLTHIRIEQNITNKYQLMEYMHDHFMGIFSNDSLDDNIRVMNDYILRINQGYKLLDKRQIEHLNEYISDRLQYIDMYKNIDIYQEIYKDLNDPDINPTEIVGRYKNELITMTDNLKKVDRNSNGKKISILDLGEYDDAVKQVTEIADKLRSPSNHISSGFKLLDKMLGGGFEKSRQYLFLGPQKGFKSGLLLNLAINACIYNDKDNIDLVKPNARPVVV